MPLNFLLVIAASCVVAEDGEGSRTTDEGERRLVLADGVLDHVDASSPDDACGGEDAENGEVRIAHPVDVITLANGNELRFYANDDGSGSLVRESMWNPDNSSLLHALGEDVTPAEVWTLAAPSGEEPPSELLLAALRDGIEIEEGLDLADSLVADLDPLLVVTWCDGSNDVADFTTEFCGTGGIYTGFVCKTNQMLNGGQVSNVEMPQSRQKSYGGWCQHGGSSAFVIQERGCSGSYTEYQGASSAWSDFYVDGDASFSQFKINRVSTSTPSWASMGIKYSATTCPG